MTGFIPASSPPGKIGFNGQTLLSVTPQGVQIVTGAGLLPRTDITGRLLYLDSLRSDPPESLTLFSPGAVSARTIGVLHNDRVGGIAKLTGLEANLKTAPTAGDGVNYWALRVVGAGGGALELPISTNGQGHYVIDNGAATLLYDGGIGGLGNVTPGPGEWGAATHMVASADITLTGFGVWFAATGPVQLIGSLLDISGNEIAGTRVAANYTGSGAYLLVNFAFPLSQVLAQGTVFYTAFRIAPGSNISWGSQWMVTGGTQNGVSGPGVSSPLDGNVAWDHANGNLNSLGVGSTAPDDAHAATYWTTALSAANRASNLQSGSSQTPYHPVVYGQGTAVSLTGDMTLSLVSHGSPAAGAAGSDLNARVSIAGS